ncbi:unnamed protein product [Zymoseptoria tritici ST99CH_1A5]|uniref:Uncharacterized protein n=2 Tax=Zymoseptoria tritici TaxID=1047171 RepID=A0A2H1G683_ZYMTR|nr:unnamed protein product [Zymoseptoria tritici ST99CH_1E4]SMR50233.1 unnamed protein product [Zymoseptoria tritici ST99CH_3D1]SMY22929.1 unnamed protein product [Zymoseptoria tritici ST99CH_1A5]
MAPKFLRNFDHVSVNVVDEVCGQFMVLFQRLVRIVVQMWTVTKWPESTVLYLLRDNHVSCDIWAVCASVKDSPTRHASRYASGRQSRLIP